eukprot:TRINITY_DN3154_c0_g1_i5.p1 TRINITY_DN3154_c0_g1~~TRINITY_DN3154_c0_g1_i5.p1  ORF type:complete len:260 (+),score=23.96 TRINITY_DN3154_c0_g1_i5:62-841(+)
MEKESASPSKRSLFPENYGKEVLPPDVSEKELMKLVLEDDPQPFRTRLDAESELRKAGISTLGKVQSSSLSVQPSFLTLSNFQPTNEIMMLAASAGLLKIIKFLKGPLTPLTTKNKFGNTLLHFAARGGQLHVVMYLILQGVDANPLNNFHETPLIMAAEEGHFSVVHYLSGLLNSKIEHQDKFGDTVLHFAAREGRYEICEFLAKKYPKLINMKNLQGQTAYDYAYMNAKSQVITLLQSMGAMGTGQKSHQCEGSQRH